MFSLSASLYFHFNVHCKLWFTLFNCSGVCSELIAKHPLHRHLLKINLHCLSINTNWQINWSQDGWRATQPGWMDDQIYVILVQWWGTFFLPRAIFIFPIRFAGRTNLSISKLDGLIFLTPNYSPPRWWLDCISLVRRAMLAGFMLLSLRRLVWNVIDFSQMWVLKRTVRSSTLYQTQMHISRHVSSMC